jgi:RNA polymerase primary sigma factor
MTATARRVSCFDRTSMPAQRRPVRPLLSCDEEIDLVAHGARGDRQALHRLIEANLGLVTKVALRYVGRGLDLDDLIGEGRLGLIAAAKEFDPGRGARFCTYAAFRIGRSIRRALVKTAPTIRLPHCAVELLTKWRRADRYLRREFAREPSFDEVASYLGLSTVQRDMAIRALKAGQVRAEGRSESRAATWDISTVADRGAPVDRPLEDEDERALARRLLGRLQDRERAVVAWRYGLGGEPMTLEQIGQRLGLTRERVRQIEAGAMAKLAARESAGRLRLPIGNASRDSSDTVTLQRHAVLSRTSCCPRRVEQRGQQVG